MNTILDVYHKNGAKATGNFCAEIYPAKKNDFFLSPSFGYNVLRYDWFWSRGNLRGRPEDYYQQFWDAMKLKFKFRCHWGKYLPADYGTYVRSLYPKYDEWMEIRGRMDPGQVCALPFAVILAFVRSIFLSHALYWLFLPQFTHKVFVTPYWRKHLDIKA